MKMDVPGTSEVPGTYCKRAVALADARPGMSVLDLATGKSDLPAGFALTGCG